jgi:hypothetical protein
MAKFKYVKDFELGGSPKIIYPYLQNHANMQEWFADKVTVDGEKIINFIWDNTDHYAKITHLQANKYVKYEFFGENKRELEEDCAYLEFRLMQSEITQATFLRVTDYSEMTNEKDLEDLWNGLISALKDVAGL